MIFLIITIIISIGLIINKFSTTGKSIGTQIEVVPLSSEESAKVKAILDSAEFANDVPKKNPIELRFFSFKNGERIWHDAFLIGGEKEPAIYLSLHSKYINELNENNLCEVIKNANKNKDLGFYSKYNKASLFIKYAGMLKYRSCFGF